MRNKSKTANRKTHKTQMKNTSGPISSENPANDSAPNSLNVVELQLENSQNNSIIKIDNNLKEASEDKRTKRKEKREKDSRKGDIAPLSS